MLGEHADLFQKGLVCESQGYGVGAFAYYRRIVELMTDRLLGALQEIIEDASLQAYQAALIDTRKSIVAQEKIALVKDLLPASLRPDGMNPLALLHDLLSTGLHGGDDEECLEDAGQIRTVLVFLVDRIRHATEVKLAGDAFTASMKLLLDKRAQRGTRSSG